MISDRTRIMLKFLIPQRRQSNPEHALAHDERDLCGKTIVFTGGTDGMGRVAVEMLHSMGADVVLLGRSEAKGQAVLDELRSQPGGAVTFEVCDLASMDSVRACAGRIAEGHGRIDVLVNCAGAHFPEQRKTGAGFEMNWATNYLGPFLLTHLLLERIRQSAPSRIVNLVTDVAWLGHLDLDAIESQQSFNATDAYTAGKLAMAMLTAELGERYGAEKIAVNCLNPGFIQTNLLRRQQGLEAAVQKVMRRLASPTIVGADRIVRLVAAQEYGDVSGAYVYEDAVRPAHSEVRDAVKRARLMEHTERVLAPWLNEPVEVTP